MLSTLWRTLQVLFFKLSNLGSEGVQDPIQLRGIQNSNRSHFLSIVVVGIIAIFYYNRNYSALTAIVASLSSLYLLGWIIASRGHHLASRIWLLTSANLAIFGAFCFTGSETGTQIFFIVTMITPFVVFMGPDRSWAFITSLIPATLFIWLEITPPDLGVQLTIDAETAQIARIIQFYSAALIIGLEIYMFVASINAREREIEQAYQMLSTELKARVKAEEMVRDQRAALVNTSRLSAMGEMAAGLAHEINNPLSIIEGRNRQFKHLLQSEQADPEQMNKIAESVDASTQRVSKIIQNLRHFARDGSGDPFEKIRVKEIVEDAISFCSARLTCQGIDLQTNFPQEEMYIDCRSVQISQVILNLINNAHDAIYGGKNPWIKILVEDTAESVIIGISDSGEGIPESLRTKVMQPFFTTKEVGKGTGLGLSISRGIIEDHGGRLWIDLHSKESTLKIWLPKVQPDADTNDQSSVA